ncbi:Thymidylate kinase-like protein [Candidatus Koribacter versatilis Ellin345]|uniref:Thymidylate kinase-like protein n=1 Tax=Koribacter versatilis (strain Ellin345) TaxID=204669 RepID=Q1IJX5_KORVE|nr:thymidylate kinase [Candidatus Koribacter versatilis]ABF42825.1 Thymidylate kinase-like protein [Candidatus Koribacter versatilis Ellin345]
MALLTFSGIDCCGKSTQIELLMEQLKSRGNAVSYMWLRLGYTPGFQGLKSLLRRVAGKKAAPAGNSPQRERFMKQGWKRRLWLYLAIGDMFWQTAVVTRWKRSADIIVICDRYLRDSEFDLAMNFPEDTVTRWWSWRLMSALAARPDVALLMDLSFEESLRRSLAKSEPFPDSEDRRRERAEMYRNSVRDGQWHVIDATRDIADIHGEIMGLVLGVDAPLVAGVGGRN